MLEIAVEGSDLRDSRGLLGAREEGGKCLEGDELGEGRGGEKEG